jgi:hypothetical protein
MLLCPLAVGAVESWTAPWGCGWKSDQMNSVEWEVAKIFRKLPVL